MWTDLFFFFPKKFRTRISLYIIVYWYLDCAKKSKTQKLKNFWVQSLLPYLFCVRSVNTGSNFGPFKIYGKQSLDSTGSESLIYMDWEKDISPNVHA